SYSRRFHVSSSSSEALSIHLLPAFSHASSISSRKFAADLKYSPNSPETSGDSAICRILVTASSHRSCSSTLSFFKFSTLLSPSKHINQHIYRQNRAVNHKTQIRKQSVYIFFLQSETAIIQSPNRQKQRQEPQHCHRFPSLSAFQISGSENPPCQEQ